MKDSGVEWIGEIPKLWEVKKLGSLYKKRNEKVSDIDYQPLSVTKNGILPQLETAAKSNDHENRKLVLKDDFVINSRADRKMSSGTSSYDGSVSLINHVLYSEIMNPQYTNYLLKNYSFAEEFYRWGSGIVDDLWSTNWDKMKKINIPIPSRAEQINIVQELDAKISVISNILTETRESIENLKKYKQSLITEVVTKGLDKNVEMKDSGIEWIGEIPKDWEMTKLRYQIIIDPSTSEINVIPEDSTFLPMDKLKNGYMDIELKGKTLENMKKYTYFAEGDITIAKVRPSFENGNIAIAKNLISKIGFGTSEIFTIRNQNKDILQEFLFYFLQNQSFIKYASSTMTGVAGLKRISSSILRDTKITVPNLNEQKQIINFLNQKTNDIETLIDKKKSLINEYESYKKSLIYEYVTGKKEVGEVEK
ncbi:restriction endonuclease subunit S [Macrococcoides bohemicum]|uniref:Restriction endonuclease subunit S n=2 Tax=Macrococcoides bohemicum TaxID=1903056 RepID=A0AAJ4PCQ7_9STAP|nr:restriction endonuclease subunit S [Macrococcus bohemicus]